MKKIRLLLPVLLIVTLFSCSESDSKTMKVKSINYQSIGDSITNLAQQSLLKEVSSHMQNEGAPATLSYCNIHALGITDSLSKAHNVVLERLSLKNRNPLNAASSEEKELISGMEQHKTYDTVLYKGKSATYYKTINVGMPACLKCHGAPEQDISPETLALIDSLYPNDLAKNYAFGDFRGVWRIQFSK